VLQLQVTTRSWLGAVTLSTGGLVADHGWLRIYGGSSASCPLPGLAHVNGFPEDLAADWQPADGPVIAHDVLGGVYALNLAGPAARGRPGEPGEVVYFAPDSMAWEPLGRDTGHGFRGSCRGPGALSPEAAMARMGEGIRGPCTGPGNLRLPVSLVSGGTPGPERRQPPSGSDARAAQPAW
jgi:Protein of unknown function DUF2625